MPLKTVPVPEQSTCSANDHSTGRGGPCRGRVQVGAVGEAASFAPQPGQAASLPTNRDRNAQSLPLPTSARRVLIRPIRAIDGHAERADGGRSLTLLRTRLSIRIEALKARMDRIKLLSEVKAGAFPSCAALRQSSARDHGQLQWQGHHRFPGTAVVWGNHYPSTDLLNKPRLSGRPRGATKVVKRTGKEQPGARPYPGEAKVDPALGTLRFSSRTHLVQRLVSWTQPLRLASLSATTRSPPTPDRGD